MQKLAIGQGKGKPTATCGIIDGMAEYLTLKQIAENLDLNYSTARAYADRFSQFFNTVELPGVRWPVYDPQAQEIMKIIMDSYGKGQATHEVLGALEDRYGTIIDTVHTEHKDNERTPITTPLTQVSELLRTGQVGMEYAMESLRFYRQIVQAKDDEIAELRAEIERLKAKDDGD